MEPETKFSRAMALNCWTNSPRGGNLLWSGHERQVQDILGLGNRILWPARPRLRRVLRALASVKSVSRRIFIFRNKARARVRTRGRVEATWNIFVVMSWRYS